MDRRAFLGALAAPFVLDEFADDAFACVNEPSTDTITHDDIGSRYCADGAKLSPVSNPKFGLLLQGVTLEVRQDLAVRKDKTGKILEARAGKKTHTLSCFNLIGPAALVAAAKAVEHDVALEMGGHLFTLKGLRFSGERFHATAQEMCVSQDVTFDFAELIYDGRSAT